MKVFKTNLWIDRYNEWWNGNTKIENIGIIRFFKINLHYDGEYFIHIKHPEQEEKGYLKLVEGFPLICEDIEFFDTYFQFLLDNQKLLTPDSLFYDPDQDKFWGLYLDKEYTNHIPYLVSSKVVQLLSPYINEKQNEVFIEYNSKVIPIIKKSYLPSEKYENSFVSH
ncbi:MAG: hypothetical protein NZ853_09500 [Leptospiraceae bacterium]|nr:hypothetical protein [Leptospiraceae bacterium]MDW7975665.1 hypothetical protein [Leptospiraceae bacterium]